VSTLAGAAVWYGGVAGLLNGTMVFSFVVDVAGGSRIHVSPPEAFVLACPGRQTSQGRAMLLECIDEEPPFLQAPEPLPLGAYTVALEVDLPLQAPEANTFSVSVADKGGRVVEAARQVEGRRIANISVLPPTLVRSRPSSMAVDAGGVDGRQRNNDTSADTDTSDNDTLPVNGSASHNGTSSFATTGQQGVSASNATASWANVDIGSEAPLYDIITVGVAFTQESSDVGALLVWLPAGTSHVVQSASDVQSLGGVLPLAGSTKEVDLAMHWADVPDERTIRIRLEEGAVIPPGEHHFQFAARAGMLRELVPGDANTTGAFSNRSAYQYLADVWYISLCNASTCSEPDDNGTLVTFPLIYPDVYVPLPKALQVTTTMSTMSSTSTNTTTSTTASSTNTTTSSMTVTSTTPAKGDTGLARPQARANHGLVGSLALLFSTLPLWLQA